MKRVDLPKWARHLFEWYAGHAKIKDLLGDLDDLFEYHLKSKSPLRAKMIYWLQVILLILSFAVKKAKA